MGPEKAEKRKRYRRAIYSLLMVFLGILVLTLGLRFFLGTTNPFYTVVSGSMEPTLNIGDIVIVRDSNTFYQITVGDIIVFKSPLEKDKVIVHRVVGIREDMGERALITKGDNNLSRDPWIVKETHYLGKMLFSIPKVGLLSTFFHPPVNYILIGLILVLLFLSEIRKK